MKVNDKKFDDALHEPIYYAKMLEGMSREIQEALSQMVDVYAKVNALRRKMLLHRQELLNMIKE